jgi:ABC-type uncharacterized transport system substrate-binding protein
MENKKVPDMDNQRMNVSYCLYVVAIFLALTGSVRAEALNYDGKKILFVNSYHKGTPWSDGIYRAVENTLRGTGIQLVQFEMDTKRHSSELSKKKAAEKARSMIGRFRPDLVIASDDNASKYLIVPFYKHSHLPFVFCGVNWDASDYGFPTENITGMIEVQLIDQILATLKKYARGERIGFIKGDDLSARKEALFYEKRFNIKIDKRFVKNYSQWKHAYLDLQEKSDMILVGNSESIADWDPVTAKLFVETNTEVPTGNWDKWMKDYALVTFATVPAEQGQWAAETALKILDGTPPGEIPVVTNKKAEIYRNMRIAKKLKIVFPIDFIRRSRSTTMR